MPGPTRNSDYAVLIQSYNVDEGRPISVLAPMPENFMFDSTSNYEAPFAQGLFSSDMLRLASAAAGFKTSTQALTVQLWQGISDTELGLELEFQTETDPISEVRDPILNLLRLTTPLADPNTGLMKSPGPHLDQEAVKLFLDDVVEKGKEALKAAGEYASSLFGDNVKSGSLNAAEKTTADGTGASNKVQNKEIMTAQYWKQRIKNQISIQIGNYMFFDSVVITNVQQTFVSNIDAVTGWPHHAKVAVRFKPLFMITQQDLDTIFISPRSQQAGSGSIVSSYLGALNKQPKGIFS